jgi:hypothetical protein
MFRLYDHHQAEKYIITLGLLNWQQIRCYMLLHINLLDAVFERNSTEQST